MANYKIINNCGYFEVIETQTNQVIYTHSLHSEAKKMMRHLNLGGSFDGWTPTFFTNVSFRNSIQASYKQS